MASQENICCPLLEDERWENQTHNWSNKPFVTDSLPTFFHIPFPPMIGKTIRRLDLAIANAKQAEDKRENTLVLFHDPGPFRTEILISVKGPVAGVKNTTLSGTFFSKVFSGGYNTVPTHIKAMETHLNSLGKKANAIYIHYAYCPNCAKKYGSNKMILFAKV